MTIGEMRDLMRQKIVPENVLPQNMGEMLIDENKELPELDAFTFLNRLRALGISSADFSYLLEGCGAPADVVEKIRNNPAMNLQSLILTLESSGLTPRDYTEMLYTARQIWERTLTVRLDKTEQATEGKPSEETAEPSFTEIFEKVSDEMGAVQPEEGLTQFNDDDVKVYGKEMPKVVHISKGDEQSEANLDLAEIKPSEAKPVEKSSPEPIAEETKKPDATPETAPDTIEEHIAEQPPESDENEGISENFASVFDKIKLNSKPVSDHIYDEDKTDIPEEIPEPKEISEEETEIEEQPSEPIPQTEEEEPVSQQEEQAEEDTPEPDTPAEDEEVADDDHRYGQPYNGNTTAIFKIDAELLKQDIAQLSDEEGEAPEESGNVPQKNTPYYKEGLIAGAVGAGILLVAGTALAIFSDAPKSENLSFAESGNEIFGEIYNSYNSGIMGGDNAVPYSDSKELFGDLLIAKSASKSVTVGDTVYSLTEKSITLQNSEPILPPDNTAFITMFDTENGLYALFSGDISGECGYMLIKDGTVTYTVRQDGMMTDFNCDTGTITVGSVYTPHFYRSFTAQDTDVYLPKLGKDKTPISPDRVVLSKTTGCSYGVCGRYSAEKGETLRSSAILGNTVFAGADSENDIFALSEEKDERSGLLVKIGQSEDKETISDAVTEHLGSADYSGELWAYIEENTVYLRDKDFTLITKVENLPETPKALRFVDNTLLIYGEEKLILALDCSEPASPTKSEICEVSGFIEGNNALVYNSDSNLVLTLYTLENGKATEQANYSKTLENKPESVGAVVFAGNKCGVAYNYYDGVSEVSEYAVFGKDISEPITTTLFDDKTGFTSAYAVDEKIYAICSEGEKQVSE